MATTEDQLAGWTGPSSDTEQDKQERTERMIREAIEAHSGFDDCSYSVYTKGSYPNETNVRSDSDVDVVVQCHEAQYWKEESPGAHPASGSYTGIWTPSKLRSEVVAALKAKFGDQVDTASSTAVVVESSSARVDADVVPAFDFRYYFDSGVTRDGSKIFKKNGTSSLINYPEQHLDQGKRKNASTSGYFKQAVRIMKRVENLMVSAGAHREVPSYFVECLVYNCPDSILLRSSWMETIRGVIVHIWDELQGDEPENVDDRWLEVNRCKYLFSSAQAWSREDGRDFAKAVWNYLGYMSS